MINQKIRQASPEYTHPIRSERASYPRVQSQTSYPKVQWENTLDKRGLQNPVERAAENIDSRDRERKGRGVKSGDHGEHRVTVKKHTRIYPCCRRLADRHKAQDTVIELGMITNKGIIIRTPCPCCNCSTIEGESELSTAES